MTINTAEIEARLAKATPGPWAAIGSPQGDYTIYLVNAQPHPAMRGFTKGIGELATEDDAVFIAHAPTDIAALLAALKVETARAEAMERMWEIALDEARKANDAISTRLHQETNALKALGNAFEIERARTDRLTAQLTAANEKLAAAREGLEIIAGKRQCLDGLMSNVGVSEATLKIIDTTTGDSNGR